MIEINEKLLTMKAAAQLMRRSRPTLYNWARDGIGDVKLEVVRIGGYLYTTAEALQEFVLACTAAPRTTA